MCYFLQVPAFPAGVLVVVAGTWNTGTCYYYVINSGAGRRPAGISFVNIIVISPPATPHNLPSAIVTSINSDPEGVQCFVRDPTPTLTAGTTQIKKSELSFFPSV